MTATRAPDNARPGRLQAWLRRHALVVSSPMIRSCAFVNYISRR